MRINLQDIKENGVFLATLDGLGYLYQLNNRMFMIGSNGFYEM